MRCSELMRGGRERNRGGRATRRPGHTWAGCYYKAGLRRLNQAAQAAFA
jgi:hypothetical protein